MHWEEEFQGLGCIACSNEWRVALMIRGDNDNDDVDEHQAFPWSATKLVEKMKAGDVGYGGILDVAIGKEAAVVHGASESMDVRGSSTGKSNEAGD